MAEKRIVHGPVTIKYTGYFNLKELFTLLERWMKELGYDKSEDKHEVRVYEDGKEVTLQLRPTKSISDYVKHIMKIDLLVSGMKDVKITIDGQEQILQEGSVQITMEGWQNSDNERRWMSNGFNYFMRVFIDKYIYSGYIKEFDNMLAHDMNELHTEINAFLNMGKYRFSSKVI